MRCQRPPFDSDFCPRDRGPRIHRTRRQYLKTSVRGLFRPSERAISLHSPFTRVALVESIALGVRWPTGPPHRTRCSANSPPCVIRQPPTHKQGQGP
eukprot:7377420-Prymnesium_polylepis.1